VSWVAKFLLLACLSGVFLLFLNGPDLVTSHEARVAQPARLMAASGPPWSARPAQAAPVHLRSVGGVVRLSPDWTEAPVPVNPWLVPVLNGQIRLQKPPLPYWCAAAAIRFFGFSEWVVRFPPALLAAIATFLLFDLAQKLFGRQVAWCSALVWVSTYPIADMYRKAMADPYLAFFTLLCVWAWVRAGVQDKETGRQRDKETKQRNTQTRAREPINSRFSPQSSVLSPDSALALLIFYLSLSLSLLAKGPVAALDLFIPLAAYHFCFRRRLPGSLMTHITGLVLLLAIALPWPIYIWRNVPNVKELWRYESVGELADNLENARPWWFYLPQLFYLAVPWTAMWVVGCILPFQKKSTESKTVDRRKFFPLLWWGATALFFSLVIQKKNQYLLPAIAAQAIIIGQALAALLGWLRETRFRGLAGALAMTQTIVSLVFAIVCAELIARIIGAPRMGRMVGIIGAIISLAPLAMIAAKRPSAWLIWQAIAYVVLIVLAMHFYTTPLDDARSPKPVARAVMALCRDPNYTVLVPRLPEEASVYLPIDLRYGFGTKVLAIVDDTHGVRQRGAAAAPQPIPQPKVENFAGWVPDARVVSVKRLEFNSLPPDYRWKVYELTVERRGYAMNTWQP
jgi:4-amino-4-deoxy-L-arabinose transferase-like glycosyltransferase